ncbi:LysR family transcriptional regulator [Paraburkholderia pallida]|uniref:LysR family transcriptional regulator n=1 Tax=Paraburkholderia pallida TaxID=2547399 RepID=A0A4P7CN32_9BURK|nr:LysR family transcriptional regulator [Paraburkholderia pallida]QBQ97168.1 LysR family transcriptional regulator [Paraburkholderia pallida]
MNKPAIHLPPLEWVRVFEAAGRLGSFTAAANELGLTQAAVSQRIRNLEVRLGAPLFDRQARGVSLSMQGEAWLPHIQAALAQLSSSTANLFESPRRKITIAASASIIELWIAPRLARIAAALPSVQLTFETVQRLPDYALADADYEIRFGDGHWPERAAKRLFQEELAPLAAPALLGNEAERWERLPYIATSGPRVGWRDWCTVNGTSLPPVPLLRFDTFVFALRAAEAGAGILLGSLPLCRFSIETGRLQRLTENTLQMESSYWVTWRATEPDYPERQTLIRCLTES